MATWTISNGTVSTEVEANMNPTFVLKVMEDVEINGAFMTVEKTYVTILVAELTGSKTVNPRRFYEEQFTSSKTGKSNGQVYEINSAGERMQGDVNVVNVHRPPN
jgi:hypothetical protein